MWKMVIIYCCCVLSFLPVFKAPATAPWQSPPQESQSIVTEKGIKEKWQMLFNIQYVLHLQYWLLKWDLEGLWHVVINNFAKAWTKTETLVW